MNKLTFTIIIILAAFANLLGQKHTDNSRDEVLRGSGRVNTTTLAMEFSLPLGNYPGRGINVPISLSYSSKVWRADFITTQPRVNNPGDCISISVPMFAGDSAAGWTTSMATPYIEYVGWDNLFNSLGYPLSPECESTTSPPSNYPYHLIKRIVVHLPSGETHELRVDDSYTSYYSYESQPSKNGTYYAVDSSNLKYIEDSSNATYKLLMPDGSYYSFKNSIETYNLKGVRKGETFTDRNGNYTSYNSSTNTWTDTLGRTLAAPLALTAPSSATTQTYTMPGLGGGANVVTYQIQWKKLKDTSAGTSGLTDFDQDLKYTADRPSPNPTATPRPNGYLFGSDYSDWVHSSGSSTFNPIVLTEILLPTGQSYKFSYNIYGEIDRIIYPTGGVETFSYGNVASVSILTGINAQFNRGVTERKVYESVSDTTPYEWTYSSASGVTRTTNPDGTRSEKFMHLSSDSPSYGMDNVLAGMGYKELGFNSDNQLVSQKLTHWTKSTGERHPRVDHEESIVYDSSGNGVSATTKFEYEGNLSYRDTPVLTNKTLSYAFVTKSDGGSYSPGGTPSASPTPVPTSTPSTLIRTTEMTYLISDSNYTSVKSNYTAQNIMGLVTASMVKDGAGTVVSRSETVYDESGRSPGYRGNPTTAKAWDSTKGAYTSSGKYISTSAKFDSYGNQYEATDARGCATETEFDSTYHAFPIEVTSCTPSDGTHGSNSAFVTTATFDTTTGLPLTTTDANGLKTEITYDAATLRPRYVKYYNGLTQVGPTNETIYHDESGNYWVKAKNQIDDSHYAESITYFDGLGRAWKSEEVNSGGNIFVEKEFDAEGRVSRVSNPYRTGDTKVWTTNVYDDASRIVSVTLPDSTTVTTDYGVATSGSQIGIVVTNTDQAGKQRRSITNSLGQLIRVDEPNSSGSLGTISSPNQPTYYNYSGIGKMVKVEQGSQYRYFMYDSLGRLLRVRQPEQTVNTALNTTGNPDNNSWTAGFTYNDNGSVLTSTDAKGTTITHTYDSFERPKTRSYSDSTPTVTFKHDNVTNGKGKLIEVSSSVSTSKTTSFDILGRPTAYQQETDGNTYASTYTYDMTRLVKETYPSGREVHTEFDENNDISRIFGVDGSTTTTYVNSFHYNAAGAVTAMKLGNGKWETAKYNSRQQITEIGLGNSATDTSLWKSALEYGELQTNGTVDTSKNSGNIAKQTLTVPGMAYPVVQAYKYDPLDRLSEAKETSNGSQNWIQSFGFDRYGNRTSFSQTIGSTTTTATPAIDASTNRFSSSSYTFDANGNLTVDAEGRQFTFNGDNKQTQVEDGSNNVIGTYYFDGEGKRIKKVVGSDTTIFVYSGSKLIAEYSTETPPSDPAINYTTADHLGSPRVITNAVGNVTSRRDFMPFGEELAINVGARTEGLKYGSSADNIRQKFTGYQKDEETALDFAEARMYENRHGRFTAVDPLLASGQSSDPQSFNRYSYTMNNPVNLVDPSGLLSESTGACGNRCLNSDGGSGGGFGIGLYSDNGETIEIGMKGQQAVQISRTLYIFISATTEQMQVTDGKGGKVIDAGPDFSKLKVPKGVKLEVFLQNDPKYKGMSILVEAYFKNAIQDSNALGVLTIGHGAGMENDKGVFEAVGVAVGMNYVYATDNAIDSLNAHSPMFGLFGCDSKGASQIFQLTAKDANIIAIDSGKDGYSSVNAIAHAGFAAAQAILDRATPKIVAERSNAAFLKAMKGTANFNNDKVIQVR